MSAAFDPYHRWLSISPKDQPPDHYRLLSVDRFESDPEVIHDAAERQMRHVRSYALGQHQDLSQRILNELGAAKACLLNPEKKARYDAELRAVAGDASPPQPPPAAAAADWEPTLLAVVPTAEPTKSGGIGQRTAKPTPRKARGKAKGRHVPRTMVLAGGIAAGAVLLVGSVLLLSSGGRNGNVAKPGLGTAKRAAPEESTNSSNPVPSGAKPATPTLTPQPDKPRDKPPAPQQPVSAPDKAEPDKTPPDKSEPDKASGPPDRAVAPFDEKTPFGVARPKPTDQIVYLADLEPREVQIALRGSLRGRFSVAGHAVSHGLQTHPPIPKGKPPAHLAFYLDKGFLELRGAVGIQDDVRLVASPLTFKILGNGQLLWTSRALRKSGQFAPFQVAVSDVDKLELIVDCPGSRGGCFAVWIDPLLIRAANQASARVKEEPRP